MVKCSKNYMGVCKEEVYRSPGCENTLREFLKTPFFSHGISSCYWQNQKTVFDSAKNQYVKNTWSKGIKWWLTSYDFPHDICLFYIYIDSIDIEFI